MGYRECKMRGKVFRCLVSIVRFSKSGLGQITVCAKNSMFRDGRDGQLFHPLFGKNFPLFLILIKIPFQKALGQKFYFSHFGKFQAKYFLLTSAKI